MTKAPAARRRSSPVHPGQVSTLVDELMNHINRRTAGDSLAIMSELGLTMPQLVTLHMLGHHHGLPLGAVALSLRLTPPATSHLVDQLVNAKLVLRAEDPDDRRQRRLTITPAGRRLLGRLNGARTVEVSLVLARLSPALQRQFSEVLEKVIEELSSLPLPRIGDPKDSAPKEMP